MIRVVVADDHPVVRSGIVALLAREDDIDVVGEAATGDEAVDLAGRLRPDLILMDLRMPGLTGDEATARILTERPSTKVLILTTYDSDDSILTAIEAGATGYLLKAAPPDEILAGVRSVARGEMALAPTIAATLARRVRSPVPKLSARETEVLRRVAAGDSNPTIALALHVTEATVKTHLLHVFAKLGVSDRTRAVTLALELGILRLG
ncbi:Response regulator protein VraR [Frondihabitans sp. 762G35]|uniref:response regulator n=1 Tax=Frondihabitans sp. 762G35 TaxID=1446794 RepID=UPI000D1FEDDB|nr:response regulator transcription factor [Frondihabitans sp. 762G35]ARC57384.1 Response regulator protein VraR [Frondihabitans sp. 762G35]